MLENTPKNPGLEVSEVVTPAKKLFETFFKERGKNEQFLVSDVHVLLLHLQNMYLMGKTFESKLKGRTEVSLAIDLFLY